MRPAGYDVWRQDKKALPHREHAAACKKYKMTAKTGSHRSVQASHGAGFCTVCFSRTGIRPFFIWGRGERLGKRGAAGERERQLGKERSGWGKREAAGEREGRLKKRGGKAGKQEREEPERKQKVD